MAHERPAAVTIPREVVTRIDVAHKRLVAAEEAIVKASEDATMARRELAAVTQLLDKIAHSNPLDDTAQREGTALRSSNKTSWLPHTADVDADPFIGPPRNPRAARGVSQIKV